MEVDSLGSKLAASGWDSSSGFGLVAFDTKVQLGLALNSILSLSLSISYLYIFFSL